MKREEINSGTMFYFMCHYLLSDNNRRLIHGRVALVCGYMWRLRRRAAGRCTGPYAGAAVGAMYGLCRRRASGDAAVARVVVCTVARPLVRILVRGGGVLVLAMASLP